MQITETVRQKERAILVGVVLPGLSRQKEQESLDELALLADTAGAEVVDRILQDRHVLNASTLIGSGKVHQISHQIIEKNAQLVIFDTDLSPVQLKNLEIQFKRKVLDRSSLILDIFARRARSREAQVQVELAQLEYLLPRLTRQWTHLSRQEGGIGMRGPGETQLETDRRTIRKRIGILKEELSRVELQREVRRKQRWSFFKLALVGYTNVGKSSLMNCLADAGVLVEDKLFATLDPTIRAVRLDGHRKVLLIDTVGFIRKLPPHLIASFHSTLEETIEADLLLHVVDLSHPHFEEQIGSVLHVLRDLGIDAKPMITIFNKVDRLHERGMFRELAQRFPNAVFTSATSGMGIESLKKTIAALLEAKEVEKEIRIPIEQTRTLARIHEMATVLNTVYEEGIAVIRIRAAAENIRRLELFMETGHEDDNTRSG